MEVDTVEFYDRSSIQLPDATVDNYVSPDLNKKGYVVDRLKAMSVTRHGRAYWKYLIPVRKVAG